MTQNSISVSEALKKVELGESIADFSIDFERIKIESLDVMKLSKGGVNVPQEAIYYEDDEIEFDESDEEAWERINYDPVQESEMKTEVKIMLKKDIQNWVETKNIRLDKLIENLLDGFYRSQKIVKEE